MRNKPSGADVDNWFAVVLEFCTFSYAWTNFFIRVKTFILSLSSSSPHSTLPPSYSDLDPTKYNHTRSMSDVITTSNPRSSAGPGGVASQSVGVVFQEEPVVTDGAAATDDRHYKVRESVWERRVREGTGVERGIGLKWLKYAESWLKRKRNLFNFGGIWQQFSPNSPSYPISPPVQFLSLSLWMVGNSSSPPPTALGMLSWMSQYA